MSDWDFIVTNVDSINEFLGEPLMPWFPKVITDSSGRNIKGRYYFNPVTELNEPFTQDVTYEAMVDSSRNYIAHVDRHMYPLQSFGYALGLDLASVTVSLVEPTFGGLYDGSGSYNKHMSVIVFKYIPDRCVSGINGATGAYLMKGPYDLSRGATESVTIDLTDVMTDGGAPGYIVNNDSSNITADMLKFNHTFLKSTDDGTKYVPKAYEIAYASEKGMTQGCYQPVTRILITNKRIDSFDFTDSDIVSKFWLDQIKPSAVRISVSK